MKLGIVGLPKVGKTTLFNALTGQNAVAGGYTTSVTPNLGQVQVPDERLDWLAEFYEPKKYTPAVVEFVDVAGIAKGAGKGSAFLNHLRQTDALVHVVRCFEDESLFTEPADALRDVGSLNLELILADMEVVERRVARAQKDMKGGDKRYKYEAELFSRMLAHLEDEKPLRSFEFSNEDLPYLSDGGLLTIKPVIYAANLGEKEYAARDADKNLAALKALAEEEEAAVLPVCALLEQDLSGMEPDERELFLADLGIDEMGISKLIKCSYDLLGLMSFLTAGKPEVRAWTIKKGTKAPAAAGKIHSDIERGFIRAEIVNYDDLKATGSMQAAKEKGLVRLEGKEYVMKDGDIVLFRFNV